MFLLSFCKETILDIKAFLVQYCEDRTDAGYTMVKDPLLEFNEALNIGSDWDYDPNADEFSLGSLMDIGLGFFISTLKFYFPGIYQYSF